MPSGSQGQYGIRRMTALHPLYDCCFRLLLVVFYDSCFDTLKFLAEIRSLFLILLNFLMRQDHNIIVQTILK